MTTTGKIVLVKERVDNHREGVPPHRVADKNVIVAVRKGCLSMTYKIITDFRFTLI